MSAIENIPNQPGQPAGQPAGQHFYLHIVKEPKEATPPNIGDRAKKVAGYALIVLGTLLLTGAVLTLGGHIVGLLPLSIIGTATSPLYMAGLLSLGMGIHFATNKKTQFGAELKAGGVSLRSVS